jgi:hypothetical protein
VTFDAEPLSLRDIRMLTKSQGLVAATPQVPDASEGAV